MFSKQPENILTDLSVDLRDANDWSVGTVKTFDIPLDVTTLAIEPISRLLAVGTSRGTIHIFGRSGVECEINLPQPVEVRFLQFAISTFNIVCFDGENRLHVYSLLELGKPSFVVSARYDQINSITLSPSHTHIFLATQHGDIKTFDLTCLRKSPYSMPNLWTLYEEKMVSSGVPSLIPSDPSAAHAVDVVIHPRNLDLLFVAYAGGIVLTDLTERSTIRTYEVVIVPGAPGGAGYDSHDILTHRRPMVTALAVHPSGHFFASGYDDGSIAFWAVDDDNKPLLVRTLDKLHVNILDPQCVEGLLSKSHTQNDKVSLLPEPIFKLSWSGYPSSPDPRGGETTLTILGGLTADKPLGLTVFLLPPFNPSESPSDTPTPTSAIHPFFRAAMCECLVPRKIFFYETRGVVQDHLLLPHNTPHFSGNFDPYAILLITEVNTSRTVEAYQFPPPGFLESVQFAAANEAEKEPEGEKKSADRLGSPSSSAKSPRDIESNPVSLITPSCLSIGNSGVLGCQLLQLDNDVYKLFIEPTPLDHLNLDLKGGHAYAEATNELKLLKYQPKRIVVTRNHDLTVRFFDFSPQLLLPNPVANSLLEHDWPEALPGLTIRLHDIFNDIRTSELLMTTTDNTAIESVGVASQALEVALTLKSGEVIVYHSVEHRSESSSPNASVDKDIVLLDHIRSHPGSILSPYFLLIAEKGPIATCALSDIGFLAISYQNGSLAVVDMRGPRVIYSNQKSNRKSRHSVMTLPIHLHGGANDVPEIDIIRTLTWTICALEKDSHLGVRLIAIYRSGHTEVYTLKYSGNPASWSVAGEPITCKTSPDPILGGTLVLDLKTGAPLKADRGRLAASFKPGNQGSIPGQQQCFLVVIGAKGARSAMGITGEKIGKVEWGQKVGNIQTSQVVEHMGSRALVVQTEKQDGLVYSLPYLEYICTVKLPSNSQPLTMEDCGDFIAFTSNAQSQSLSYGSLFSVRRPYMPPDIDFAVTRGIVPPQPQPVALGPASLLGSWFSYRQTLSGDIVDELLGGPDRPIPERLKSEGSTVVGQEGIAGSSAVAGFAANAAIVQSNIYNGLTSAMSERGQLLGDLEERFNSLEEGSRNMVAQAKRLATQQTAKSWFGF